MVPGNRQKLPLPVRGKIVEIKKQEPLFGVKRISQLLRRVFFLKASPETVRRRLQEESLMNPSRKKRSHNPSRPRFFERATPNQMWQSDIFTFRLGGRYAYLIGFMDDYSRYMVGLELYRSQTTDQVLEVYRRAVGEYGVPREMLTDQGRQYTNWRVYEERWNYLLSDP
jgi:transposase InsO family protein